jgi:hypothetical protein
MRTFRNWRPVCHAGEHLFRAAAAASALWALSCGISAQASERDAWFPFVVPDLAESETAGTPIDLSFLNPEPAGSHGYLRADAERIVDGEGREVRLFGSNICDLHPMPPKDQAPAMARRLKQLGFNFIRLHYFDFAKAPEGILNADMQTLNPEKLDQFDWLVSQLKENGVYVDINLHICRPYSGQPKELHRFGKGIDYIHDPYVESQKRYARDLIGHVNPYTGLSYAKDPAVAVIELNNENTLFSIWNELADLPEAFRGPAARKWNAWLKQKYGTTERLRAAWNGKGATATGRELLANGSFKEGLRGWAAQQSGPGKATASVVDPAEGGRHLRWEVTRPGEQSWHVQLYAKDVPVQHGKSYAVSFRARAGEGKRLKLTLGMMMQQSPWRDVVGRATLALTPEWREYGMTCVIANPERTPVRLNVCAGGQQGVFELADFSVREGVYAAIGSREGERLEEGTVPLVTDSACPVRTVDFYAFLSDVESAYVTGMRGVLRDELGAGSLILCTQASYGGLAGLSREARLSDLIDMHCYPCHPSDRVNAQGRPFRAVRNESMVGLAFGELERAALWRVEGKPFMMTEFDLNPPNDHASENFPLLTLMAAYQGWAGFAEYSWYNFQGGKHGHSRISSNFATTGHAGQMCMIPSMALLYRRGLVKAGQATTRLSFSERSIPLRMAGNSGCGVPSLADGCGGSVADVWRSRVACRLTADGDTALTGASGQTPLEIRSDTGEIVFDRAEKGAETLQVNAPAARLLIGYVGGRDFHVGDVRFHVGKGTFRNYANISLVALDEKAVCESRRLLLTAVARVENKGQTWDEKRGGVIDWGEGPTLAEPVPLTLVLPGEGWQARALNGKGQAAGAVAMAGPQLTTDPAHATLWYLITRP